MCYYVIGLSVIDCTDIVGIAPMLMQLLVVLECAWNNQRAAGRASE